MPQGGYDAVLGASYVQISREGLGYQKSQNGGPNIPKAGPVSSGYHRFASDGFGSLFGNQEQSHS